jgi:hypothetical protein
LNPFSHNSCASVIATGLSQLPGAVAADAKQGNENFIKNVQDPKLRPLVAVGVVALAGATVLAGGAAIVAGVRALAPIAVTVGPLGAAYTAKVLSQMEQGDYHGFPALIDRLAEESDASNEVGGDGQMYLHVRIPGCINSVQGTFHWIIDEAGNITHRLFEK